MLVQNDARTLAQLPLAAFFIVVALPLYSASDLHRTNHDVLQTQGLSMLLFHNAYHHVFGRSKNERHGNYSARPANCDQATCACLPLRHNGIRFPIFGNAAEGHLLMRWLLRAAIPIAD